MKGNDILSKTSKIDFYCFSGTGNTLLVVNAMAEVFTQNNLDVSINNIDETDPININLYNTIGLAFPVAVQSTYRFVWDFIKKLPSSNGTKIFMIDTLAGFSGGIVGPLKKVLLEKGYTPIGAKEIIMPSNWFPKKNNLKKNDEKKNKGMEKAKLFAQLLIEGRSHWGCVPFFPELFYWVARRDCVWRWFASLGKKFTVNKEICTQCQLCVKLCPVNNIQMNEYPVFSDKCQQCMKCISSCPTEAIYVPNKSYEVYRAVKS